MNPALQPAAHIAPRASHDMRQLALEALCEENPEEKTALALVLYTKLDTLIIAHEISPVAHTALPGRPVRPALTHPAKVPRRSPLTLEGRAAMMHAICHIEFNAINLALDALWRFDGMPDAYYRDWALVAKEEAHHFTLLRAHLQGMDTQCDITADGTPDALRAVAILDIILRDEVGHVAIGNHWYRWLCGRDGLDPVAHYAVLTGRHKAPKLKPPFNKPARMRAGFTRDEIAQLGA